MVKSKVFDMYTIDDWKKWVKKDGVEKSDSIE